MSTHIFNNRELMEFLSKQPDNIEVRIAFDDEDNSGYYRTMVGMNGICIRKTIYCMPDEYNGKFYYFDDEENDNGDYEEYKEFFLDDFRMFNPDKFENYSEIGLDKLARKSWENEDWKTVIEIGALP